VSAAAATRHPENKNASTATITIEYRDFISHLHVKPQTNHDHETDFVIIKRIGQDSNLLADGSSLSTRT
jgi:hypothetical protein